MSVKEISPLTLAFLRSTSRMSSLDPRGAIPSIPAVDQKKKKNQFVLLNKPYLTLPQPVCFVLHAQRGKENGSVMKKKKKEGKRNENFKTPCRYRIWREAIVWPPCSILQSDSLSGHVNTNPYFLLTLSVCVWYVCGGELFPFLASIALLFILCYSRLPGKTLVVVWMCLITTEGKTNKKRASWDRYILDTWDRGKEGRGWKGWKHRLIIQYAIKATYLLATEEERTF